ncbi:hypothetical protein C3B59_10750 [Cryobacterium zongtaii]|uniref:Lipoprotein n=1 Tax=Cryobacterium zongtaii TaxID=1259217 RepID=A0A2S3ZC73_9MICO|nr:hypothetical protein [Cryobacterium zongtaii]POH63854.1 hypothetical protein C3B59_10750 [Cryobacterium zongtaii]
MGRSRVAALAAVVVLAALLLTGCAPGANDAAATVPPEELAGFWLGLWQGFISPITFIVSLFNAEVNIYEVRNDGNFYNFGFMIGVAIAFGGPASAGGYATPGRKG